jgi:hypothetical protein
MNDHHPPALAEWFYRISAVLGMVVLFVLCMKLMLSATDPPTNTLILDHVGTELAASNHRK